MKGVTEKEESIIKSIIEPFAAKYQFYCYGSRVKGNFRPLSDLDIMVKSSNEVTFSDITKLKNDFDTSLLPYVVNIVDYNTLSEKFYNMIKDDLIRIG